MTDPRPCPDCGTELRTELVPRPDDPGAYLEVHRCPRATAHGTTVECEHGCGEQVRNPREHYSYTPGLIGSGRWRCFPKGQFDFLTRTS